MIAPEPMQIQCVHETIRNYKNIQNIRIHMEIIFKNNNYIINHNN